MYRFQQPCNKNKVNIFFLIFNYRAESVGRWLYCFDVETVNVVVFLLGPVVRYASSLLSAMSLGLCYRMRLGAQWPSPDARRPMPDARCPEPGTRCLVPGARCPVPVTHVIFTTVG